MRRERKARDANNPPWPTYEPYRALLSPLDCQMQSGDMRVEQNFRYGIVHLESKVCVLMTEHRRIIGLIEYIALMDTG